MALGAQRGGVIWMVLRQVFVLAIVGPGDRPACGSCDVETGRVVLIWDETGRSSGNRGGCRRAGHRGRYRRLRSGAPSLEDRSHGRSPARMKQNVFLMYPVIGLPTMNLKGAATFAFIGTLLAAALLIYDFRFRHRQRGTRSDPSVKLFPSFIYAFAALSVTIFFFVFQKKAELTVGISG